MYGLRSRGPWVAFSVPIQLFHQSVRASACQQSPPNRSTGRDAGRRVRFAQKPGVGGSGGELGACGQEQYIRGKVAQTRIGASPGD